MQTRSIETVNVQNPLDRIQTRESWARLNKYLRHAIEAAPTGEAIELLGFLSDLNIALHEKFGFEEAKKA